MATSSTSQPEPQRTTSTTKLQRRSQTISSTSSSPLFIQLPTNQISTIYRHSHSQLSSFHSLLQNNSERSMEAF
ncbi:hypothetical protein J5N97_012585 [Dioscorea zingiberensis]|uniref:Uncharacterized protein n=1 Tax=Dioscorea zingiberensis TaxID=325984 RepID=A0A9D5CPK2_9LILI|nr:hypothetical protein J5N97_012585 [Dioscorea zingiberensis]